MEVVVDGLQAFHTAAMVATLEGPAGDELRSHHHRLLCSLRELVEDFQHRARAASEIELALETKDEDDE